jgi:hypothetical protein
VALELGVEDAGLIGGEGEVRLELGTDVVLVGQELTGGWGLTAGNTVSIMSI